MSDTLQVFIVILLLFSKLKKEDSWICGFHFTKVPREGSFSSKYFSNRILYTYKSDPYVMVLLN